MTRHLGNLALMVFWILDTCLSKELVKVCYRNEVRIVPKYLLRGKCECKGLYKILDKDKDGFTAANDCNYGTQDDRDDEDPEVIPFKQEAGPGDPIPPIDLLGGYGFANFTSINFGPRQKVIGAKVSFLYHSSTSGRKNNFVAEVDFSTGDYKLIYTTWSISTVYPSNVTSGVPNHIYFAILVDRITPPTLLLRNIIINGSAIGDLIPEKVGGNGWLFKLDVVAQTKIKVSGEIVYNSPRVSSNQDVVFYFLNLK